METPIGRVFGGTPEDQKPFVELLTSCNPDVNTFLSPQEVIWGIDTFINIRGVEAAGKTMVCRTLLERYPHALCFAPEAMTRPPRQAFGNLRAEEDGKDLIYMDDARFDQALATEQFLFAYRVHTQRYNETGEIVWKSKRAGLLKDTVRQAVRSNKRSLLILPPPIDMYLRDIFPQTDFVLVSPNTEDFEFYRTLRQLTDQSIELQANRQIAFKQFEVPGTVNFPNRRWKIYSDIEKGIEDRPSLERVLLKRRTRFVVQEQIIRAQKVLSPDTLTSWLMDNICNPEDIEPGEEIGFMPG
jgi:guanylate kinase